MTCTIFAGKPVKRQRGSPKSGHPKLATAFWVTGTMV